MNKTVQKTKFLPGLSKSIRDMSVPIEATRNSNNNESNGHDNWDSIGDVDVYI